MNSECGMRTISLCNTVLSLFTLYCYCFTILFHLIVLSSHVLRFIEFLRTLVKTGTCIGVIVAGTATVLLVTGSVLVMQYG